MHLWIATVLIACSGPSEPLDPPTYAPVDDTGPGPTGTTALDGPCPMSADLGGFSVASDELLTVVGGAVLNGVVPITVFEEVGSEGGCVLLRQNNPFCNPSCLSGETCDFSGSCIPFPVDQSLGTVVIEGLTDPVEMNPNPPGASYYALGLSHPPHAPGDLVTLRASGDELPAFTMHGEGLEPLVLDGELWEVETDTDLVVSWNPPTVETRATVHLGINMDQHGVTPVQLSCEFEDTGQATVPAALLTQLIEFGVTGIPSGKLTRRTVDSVQLPLGCAQFEVSWRATPEVDIIGFTPCQTTAECPSGQTCNTQLEICE